MGCRVWAIVRALSGRERKASSLSLSPSFFFFLSFSLFFFLFPSRTGLHYFIIFKHVTFLTRDRSFSLFLSGRGKAMLQKNMLEIVQSGRPALLDIINVDRLDEFTLAKGEL